MSYKKVSVQIKPSKTVAWAPINTEWDNYKKTNYVDTGKITLITRRFFDDSDEIVRPPNSISDCTKVETVTVFNNKASFDEYQADSTRLSSLTEQTKSYNKTNSIVEFITESEE